MTTCADPALPDWQETMATPAALQSTALEDLDANAGGRGC